LQDHLTGAFRGGLEQMARRPGLSYRTPLEELSEKSHASEDLLRTLNPGADFDRPGTTIAVSRCYLPRVFL
jgi:hypothetical protein